uniref:Uncharacterized protein n=1 Tax=Romanomermis culicivorax TaxID=13658 RepID=A0A915I0Q3_ROMCU
MLMISMVTILNGWVSWIGNKGTAHAKDRLNIGMCQEMGTDDTLIITIIIEDDAFDHMFSKSVLHALAAGPEFFGPWRVCSGGGNLGNSPYYDGGQIGVKRRLGPSLWHGNRCGLVHQDGLLRSTDFRFHGIKDAAGFGDAHQPDKE